MKHSLIILPLLWLTAVLLPGCKDKNEADSLTRFKAGEKMIITSDLSDDSTAGGPKRVHGGDLSDSQRALLWSKNDQIYVVMGSYYQKDTFTLSSGEDTPNGTFSGFAPADADNYYVLYPADNAKTVSHSDGQIKFTGFEIPQIQTEIDFDTVFSYLPMAGYGTGSTFLMTNMGCVLKIKLWSKSGKSINQFWIFGTNTDGNRYLAGSFNYKLTSISEDGRLSVERELPSGQYDHVQKDWSTAHPLSNNPDTAETFYFVLAGPVTTKIKLSVTSDNTVLEKSFDNKNLHIDMGEIKTIAPSTGAFNIDEWTEVENATQIHE